MIRFQFQTRLLFFILIMFMSRQIAFTLALRVHVPTRLFEFAHNNYCLSLVQDDVLAGTHNRTSLVIIVVMPSKGEWARHFVFATRASRFVLRPSDRTRKTHEVPTCSITLEPWYSCTTLIAIPGSIRWECNRWTTPFSNMSQPKPQRWKIPRRCEKRGMVLPRTVRISSKLRVRISMIHVHNVGSDLSIATRRCIRLKIF